jgi:hypothetical protein
MERDPHGEGSFGDQYKTTSLYFDTDDHDVFHRRDSYGRSKYRVRRYDGLDSVFLERKLRTASLLQKRRTQVPLDELALIGSLDPGWAGRWFDERLALRNLHPTCQVTYRRVARVSTTTHGPIRLTLDTDVRALTQPRVGFVNSQGDAILHNRAVLELKFPVVFPVLFKELVQDFKLSPARASKYRTAAHQLGFVPEVHPAAVAIEVGGATYA